MVDIGIERSRNNRMIMGVCGGIAEHLNVSARLIRLATVLAAVIIPGVSIWMVLVAYIIAAIVLPEEDGIRV